MKHQEMEIIEFIKNDYKINNNEILCAAYLHTPSNSPEEYLILNAFAKKEFSILTPGDSRIFIKSSFSAFNEKEGFLRFLNHNHKISKKILSQFINIREEKYSYGEWEGSLFIAPRKDVLGKIGIELFYEKNIEEFFDNPISYKKNTTFEIIDVGSILSKEKELLRLYITNKYILM